MPAVFGGPLTTSEDSEKESEYGSFARTRFSNSSSRGKKKFTMLRTWPVRTPRPVASKLAADTLLLTGVFLMPNSPLRLVVLVPFLMLLVGGKPSFIKPFRRYHDR